MVIKCVDCGNMINSSELIEHWLKDCPGKITPKEFKNIRNYYKQQKNGKEETTKY